MNSLLQKSLFRGVVLGGGVIALAISSGIAPTVAIPVSTPAPGLGEMPTPLPASGVLPYDSSLIFVLDDPISSISSKAHEIVHVHLKDALVLSGVMIAAAGTPAEIQIERAVPAKSGDVYGYVDIYFLPMKLSDGKNLPLRAPTSHLTVTTSVGHESTVGLENTVEDVFIPGGALIQIIRKGRNLTLGAGSEIRARTAAALSVDKHGAISMQTSLPVPLPAGSPVTSFQALPYATESSPHPGNRHTHPAIWTPSPEPSLPPLPETPPTSTPSASPTATPNASASPSPSSTP